MAKKKERKQKRVQKGKWPEDSFLLQKAFSEWSFHRKWSQGPCLSRHHSICNSFEVLQYLVCFIKTNKQKNQNTIPSFTNWSASPDVSNDVFYLRSKWISNIHLSYFFLKGFGGSPVAIWSEIQLRLDPMLCQCITRKSLGSALL